MSDDDDDGVDPQIEDVNDYYFEFEDEDGEREPVCFSILPFQFGEDDNEADFSRKNVFLRGFVDKSVPVYKEVVAWKIRLDTEQPNIYVLSIKHKWIKLLKPRKCYGEFARSILITVQMLHFVRRGGQRRSLNHLWDHLDEVFGKYNPKPVADDFMKHATLIKLFVEKDQTLMKSKILQRLIKNGFERTKKALGLESQFIVSGGRRVRKNDDNNYGNKDNSGDDCDDGDGSSDDDDESSDDGTDQICAICDDGGQLLSCEGPCKRSFHATEKDGRESKCETLGYTSAKVKRIGTFLCANCKNKQHQCFRCGELEPSHGPNAKVFQCNQASCGYFYHPKCVAQLLDPNATDGACELERRIMAGMSFPCPIHWCFKCGRMENKTQRALQLAVCRRCPRAYHRECLPRELSLGAKDKDGNPRAWQLSKTIFIYCLDHEIDKDTGTASRNHIKFPATPECNKTKELGNSKGRMTGKRRKNTDQSTKPTELSNRLCGAESEQADNVGAKSTSPQIVVEPHCAAKLLRGDPQIEQSIIGVAASQNGAETMKGHEKQFGISSCVASTETEKRVTCLAGTPSNGWPSTKGMSDCSVQDTPVDKDVELDDVACRITEDKYANGREKTQEDYTRKETAHHKESSENQGQNDVLELDNLWVEIQADGSPLEPGNKRDNEWQENAYGLGSASGQEKETSRRENPESDRGMVPRNDSKIIDYRKGGTTVDTGAASRNHIKFPATAECTKTKELGDGKGRMTGKRRKNTDQSTKPTELSNRLCGAESEQADNVGAKSTSPQIIVEPHCAAKRFKDDPQIEQSIIGVGASQNGAETMNGHEKQFGISSCVASTETEKRVTCLAQKGTCLGTPYDGPSTKDMSDCSVEDNPVDKDVELDNVACRITEDKYTNGREKIQEACTRKETAQRKDSSENQGQNDVLELDNLLVEIQADGSPLEPGNKRDNEWQENAYGLGSASGQEKESSSRRENPESDRGMPPRNDSKIIDYRKGGTVDNVDDHSSEGSYSCQGEWSRSKCNDGLVAIDQDTSSDRSKKRSQPVENASDGNKTDLDNKKHNLREDGRDADYEDRRTGRNTAADTSRYKCRDKTQSDRREEDPVERNTRTRSREHSPEWQRMDRGDSYPGTYNRQRCESLHSVNSSRGGGDDRRQLSPCQSSFPSPEFGGNHSHLYPRDSQYRTSGRHNPPQYLGIPLYRPYAAASMGEHSAMCYRLAGGYGEGSCSSRPVTERYAPHLDRTNCQPRSQNDLQASWPVTERYAPHLDHTNYQPRSLNDLQASRPVTERYAPHLDCTNYQPRSQSDLQYGLRLVQALHNNNLV